MGLHTSGHTRKNSSFSTQDEHLVLLGLEALTDGPQPPLRDTLYLRRRLLNVLFSSIIQAKCFGWGARMTRLLLTLLINPFIIFEELTALMLESQ